MCIRDSFRLWYLLDFAIQLRCRSLINSCLLCKSEQSDCFKNPQGPYAIHIGRIFRFFETHLDMGHGAEIIDFIWLDFLDDANDISSIRQVSVVQDEIAVINVGILVKMINT